MSNISRHPDCKHRSEIGNCLTVGGFCTAVPISVCEAERGKNLSGEQCERLIKEYISKCKVCDECFAEIFCITNGLRESREPQSYCVDNIKAYLTEQEHE